MPKKYLNNKAKCHLGFKGIEKLFTEAQDNIFCYVETSLQNLLSNGITRRERVMANELLDVITRMQNQMFAEYRNAATEYVEDCLWHIPPKGWTGE